MRGLLVGSILVLFALPAWAEVFPDQCGDSDPDVSIDGCTSLIEADNAAIELRVAGYMTRAVDYNKKTLYDQAIADFTKVIELYPQLPKPDPEALSTSYIGRGMAYYWKQTYDPAIADFTKVIALKPDYVAGYKLRGSAYEMKALPKKALADYRAGLKLSPADQALIDAVKRLGDKH